MRASARALMHVVGRVLRGHSSLPRPTPGAYTIHTWRVRNSSGAVVASVTGEVTFHAQAP